MAHDRNLTLKRITFENREDDFFLYSRCDSGKRFFIDLFSVKNSEAYRGDVSEIDLRSSAAAQLMTYTEFLADYLGAITCSNDSTEVKFLYSLEENAGVYYFRWKRVLESEDIKLRLGSVKVSTVDFRSVIEFVLCEVSVELCALGRSLKKTKSELEESNRAKERSHDLIQSAIKMKEDMEKELYSKFVIILNKKKEKIRKLKRQVKASTPESASSDEAMDVGTKKRAKKVSTKNQPKRTHARILSDSENEDLEFTDDGVCSKPGPSRCRKPSRNSSLLLADDFDTECPVQPQRQRHPKVSHKRDAVPSQQKEVEEHNSLSKAVSREHSADDSIDNLLDML